MPTATLQCLHPQYFTWICCLELKENFFKAQQYSLKHMKIGRIILDYRLDHLKYLCLTTTQHSQWTDIYALGGNSTHNPIKPEVAIPLLRPRGQ
jgi:hypothetical protein